MKKLAIILLAGGALYLVYYMATSKQEKKEDEKKPTGNNNIDIATCPEGEVLCGDKKNCYNSSAKYIVNPCGS